MPKKNEVTVTMTWWQALWTGLAASRGNTHHDGSVRRAINAAAKKLLDAAEEGRTHARND